MPSKGEVAAVSKVSPVSALGRIGLGLLLDFCCHRSRSEVPDAISHASSH